MIEFGILHSKVARRIFGFFVLSALVPIAVTAALAFFQVNKVLTAQSEEQLRNVSKTYGISIYEKLLFMKGEAREVAARFSNDPDPGDYHELSREQLRGVVLITDSGEPLTIHGDIADWRTFVPSSRQFSPTRLITKFQPGGSVRVLMSLDAEQHPSNHNLLLVEIDPAYLWGAEDAFPFAIDICIFGRNWRPLFCSNPLFRAAPGQITRQLDQGGSQRSYWEYMGERYLTGHWELFLEANFDYPRWTIIASQSQEQALAPVVAFKQIFPLVVGGSILLVVLLSLSQIRRNLVPLEKLISGTRLIADKNFAQVVEVDSADEFGDLARSFNAMSHRLGRQFHALKALSDIDRLILSKPDFELVLKMVLKNLPRIAPCDYSGIVINRHDDGKDAQVYVEDHHNDGFMSFDNITLAPAEIEALLARPNIPMKHAGKPIRSYLVPLARLGAATFFVMPISYKKRFLGIVMLGYTNVPALTAEDISQVRDLADRVAVALSVEEHERTLFHQAHYDALTGLPNRQFLMERLEQEIALGQRQQSMVVLLFIDLDRFKQVNDSMGHAAGDELLEQAAQRLRDCARETDVVARLGGDEFAIALFGVSKPRYARRVAEDIVKVLSIPFSVHGQEHFLSASIGVAVYPYDGDNGADLLRNADVAMYKAKQNKRQRYFFFKEEMNSEILRRMEMERDLYRALERGEFILYYQPQLDLRVGRVTGAEVLIRWRHPRRGMILPGIFVPMLEDLGLIETIGEWALRKACLQYQMWQAESIAPERLGINVSCRQFKDKEFVAKVGAALEESSMPAANLELEITESIFIEDIDDTCSMLEQLHTMGLRLSIDDFGTGYSSLSYLQRFSVDTLKIDRSFLTNVPQNKSAAALVNSIVVMAHSLGKEVIAEGVETKNQMDYLRAKQCDLAQGYYLSPPLAADEFSRFIHRRNLHGTVIPLPKRAKSRH